MLYNISNIATPFNENRVICLGLFCYLDNGVGVGVDLVTGVGVGVRWFSPVGPIRVDVAHPLDDPTTQWRLYVTIGPDL